jgi:hypothetical protein
MNRTSPIPQASARSRFDAALSAALEHKPAVSIPANFAARIAARVPARPAAVRSTHYGRTIAYVSMLLLALALTWLPVAHPAALRNISSWSSLTELTLILEMLALLYFTEFSPVRD